jgi:hypothetical protein
MCDIESRSSVAIETCIPSSAKVLPKPESWELGAVGCVVAYKGAARHPLNHLLN